MCVSATAVAYGVWLCASTRKDLKQHVMLVFVSVAYGLVVNCLDVYFVQHYFNGIDARHGTKFALHLCKLVGGTL